MKSYGLKELQHCNIRSSVRIFFSVQFFMDTSSNQWRWFIEFGKLLISPHKRRSLLFTYYRTGQRAQSSWDH